MANYRVTDSELTGIADAIRLKGGTSDPLVFPSGFASAINAIETQGTYISKTITSNGEYDPASDNADAFSHVTVSVPTGSSPVLVSKSISENGTYNPSDDNADAYSQVVVNVSGGGGGGNYDNFLIAVGAKSGIVDDSSAPIIRAGAFAYNDKITGVIGRSVTSIHENAFSNCSELSFASFPLCTYVNNYAFYVCSKLETLSIPNCSSIGGMAFSGCKMITEANFPLCESVGQYAFASCSELSNLSFPVCKIIGASAFNGCSKIQKVDFPECLKISQYAFYSCKSVSIVNLPKCTSISAYAFHGCVSLFSLYLTGSSVVRLAASTLFLSTPMTNSSYYGEYGSIFVPASLVDSYKSASYWSYFSDRITSYVEE